MPDQTATSTNHAPLCQVIADEIARQPQQRISFATFMELALYHPDYGYYAASARRIGPEGDFITSPHLGSDFGELLAAQFNEMWQVLGCPQPFTLVEMGAGQGLLAGDILTGLRQNHPDCFAASDYRVVERSRAAIAVQQHRLQPLLQTGAQIQWQDLTDIPPDSVNGCFFSNELVDALPVHLVTIVDQHLQEIYVTTHNSGSLQWAEVVGELSTSDLADYFNLVNIPFPAATYEEGYRTEVNLAALDWLQTVAERLRRGYVLTIDYGYPAQRYYHPGRTTGTLQAYYRHSHHNDPYYRVGEQDLTAHVDFTALERLGERLGLIQLGYVQQSLFLMALGLGERIAAISQSQASTPTEIQAVLQRRQALHLLMDPEGMGRFGVLLQAKGLTPDELASPLKGLSLPQ